MKLKLQLSTKLFAGFLAISLLFAAVVFVNYQLSRTVLRNSQRVANSQRITGEGTTLLRNIIDMETGFRGYLLIGNEAVLAPYYEGERNLLGRFVRLRNDVVANDTQFQRLRRAQTLFRGGFPCSSVKARSLRRTPPRGRVGPGTKCQQPKAK
jgi:CHASE3 domain sensor protein